MARTVTLLDDRVRLEWSLPDSALVLRQWLEVPFDTIQSVDVGMAELPHAAALRRVGTSAPFVDRRQGYFWQDGRSLFLDIRRDRTNTIVLRLKPGSRFDIVAWDGEDSAALAPPLRDRLAA